MWQWIQGIQTGVGGAIHYAFHPYEHTGKAILISATLPREPATYKSPTINLSRIATGKVELPQVILGH